MLFLLLLACDPGPDDVGSWTIATWTDPDRPGVVCYSIGSPLVQAAALDCLYVPASDPTGAAD